MLRQHRFPIAYITRQDLQQISYQFRLGWTAEQINRIDDEGMKMLADKITNGIDVAVLWDDVGDILRINEQRLRQYFEPQQPATSAQPQVPPSLPGLPPLEDVMASIPDPLGIIPKPDKTGVLPPPPPGLPLLPKLLTRKRDRRQ